MKLFVMTIKAGVLKNVNIPNKMIALQFSWIRRLYGASFHEWKLIPLYVIETSCGTSLKLHSNLLFKSSKTKFFPSFYREIISNWKKHLAMMAEIPSCILSQYLRDNKNIQVDNVSTFLKKVSIMFCNFSVTVVSFKKDSNFRENTTYMKVHILNGYN